MTPAQQNNMIAWIAKLLSGNYKQGTDHLYDPETNCYCVNGVLAGPVAEFPFLQGKFFFGSHSDSIYIDDKGFSDCFVPERWFKNFTGLLVPPERFARLNDGGMPFVDLAIYLISYLPDGPRKEHMQRLARSKRAEMLAAQTADLTRHSDEEAKGDEQ